ncbi:SDR family oxidoreductase [Chitinimonas sp.]|uniref:SDR family oxidoreductase n=1 Tax=Chitinimonas sp. TaxID=1934313 RepID=UPI002F91CC0B
MSLAYAFQSQRVVVIGGSSGIGRGVALAAKAQGAEVVVLGRSAKATDGLRAIAADIANPASLARAFAEIGQIDHLVITAGARVGSSKLADLTSTDLELTYQIKLFGALYAIQAALPYLAPTASITLTSGLLSRKFGAGNLLKSTANAAVEAAGKSLAKELAPRRVNVISPGVIDTELWGEAGSEQRTATMARIGAGLPVSRVGQTDDIAAAYLLVMQNGFMTGAVVDVEGGGLL